MSRTDKDRPWLIRAEDPNDRPGPAYFRHSCGYNWHGQYIDCDAHVPAAQRYTESIGNQSAAYRHCGWVLPYWMFTSSPADYRRAVWHGPERRRERDQLGAMVKEWNANYYLDDDGDFTNRQARHCADAWWW